jgi:hypothetical protein
MSEALTCALFAARPAAKVCPGRGGIVSPPNARIYHSPVPANGLVHRCLLAAIVTIVTGAGMRAQTPAPDVLQQAAEYLSGFVHDLSNVVAQEEFELITRASNGVQRSKVVSDFMLVRYPGSEQDWLAFRAVQQVNGVTVLNQQDRATELFLRPFADALQRAREIAREGERIVPTIFNPLLAISFFQAEYQPRFRFTVRDIDSASGARAVQFVETARPTLFLDRTATLPIQGTAWIEEDSGRIVRTELRIGAPTRTVRTTFRRDDRLAIMVPDEMNASHQIGSARDVRGTATYGNFRRFEVRTEESLDLDVPTAR